MHMHWKVVRKTEDKGYQPEQEVLMFGRRVGGRHRHRDDYILYIECYTRTFIESVYFIILM